MNEHPRNSILDNSIWRSIGYDIPDGVYVRILEGGYIIAVDENGIFPIHKTIEKEVIELDNEAMEDKIIKIEALNDGGRKYKYSIKLSSNLPILPCARFTRFARTYLDEIYVEGDNERRVSKEVWQCLRSARRRYRRIIAYREMNFSFPERVDLEDDTFFLETEG